MLRMFTNIFKCLQVFFKMFQKHNASVCLYVSIVFRHMLQVFYLKFYLNFAYVAVATHMFQMFHLF
jgi:hypothetical protein